MPKLPREDHRARLTSKYVSALRPGSVRYTVTDESLPGFSVRVSPSGEKRFAVRYRVAGGNRERQTFAKGTSYGEAKQRARDILSLAREGHDFRPQPGPAGGTTVAQLAREFMRTSDLKPLTVETYERLLRLHILPSLGELSAKNLTPKIVRDWHAKRAQQAGPTAANRSLSLLRAILRRVGDEADLDRDPTMFVRRRRETRRKRVLTRDEIRTLEETLDECVDAPPRTKGHISPVAAAYIRTLLYTGQRSGEMLRLRWADVRDGYLVRRDLKKGDSVIPLTEIAREYLEWWKEQCGKVKPTDLVFANSEGNELTTIKRTWRTVIRPAAGLDGEDGKVPTMLHSLRHTFITQGTVLGIPMATMGVAASQSDIRSTKDYVHIEALMVVEQRKLEPLDDMLRELVTW